MRFFTLFCFLFSSAAFAGTYTISTVAGSNWVGENVPATSAILIQAEGVVTDTSGNIYISDVATNRVRCITNGIIRTIAGNGVAGFAGDGGQASTSQLNAPYGMAFDFAGNLYIADLGNARIRRITPGGIITTVAGGGSLTAGGANEGSMATMVSFVSPRNVAVDGNGILYISDYGANRVYRMGTDGTLTTLAGTGSQGYSQDGIANQMELNHPTALAVDRAGTVYIADSGNKLIRKVSAGILTTLVRSGPLATGLAYDGIGTLYVADHSVPEILEISLSNLSQTVLNISATDVVYGNDNTLYVADMTFGRHVIQLTGVSTVIAGGGNLAEGDGGPATQALLAHPSGIAMDGIGNLYIADQANNRIRRVGLNGTITTLAGTGVAGNTGDGGSAALATLNGPTSVSFDSFGNLYIADTGNARIRMVTSGGLIQPVPTGALTAPAYMIFDSSQNMYIADTTAIYKVTPAGVTSTFVGGLQSPRGMVFDASGNFYFTNTGAGQVWMYTPSGSHSSIATGIWGTPQGIAIDSAGNVLVADSGLNQILKISSTGELTIVPIAGTGTAGFTGDGASSVLAELSGPNDVLISSSSSSNGAIYLVDSGNNRVRQLVLSNSTGPGSPVVVVTAVNAASLTPGPVAPGMLIALENTGLTASQLAQTQVTFNGTAAPMLSVVPTEVLVRAPISLQGVQSVQIAITSPGAVFAPITANVVTAAPALFTVSSSQAAITNQDGTLNSSTNPAVRGGVISLYGTGEGVTGLPFSVTIGGNPATILYSGPSGSFPGMFQINAQVPGGTYTGGALPIVVTVGTATTQAGLTINVQ
jgi:uncharacterized protein (TIGR03437 family)